MTAADVAPSPAIAFVAAAPAEAVRTALDNFAALLADADFTVELQLLRVGRLQFLRRRQMLFELRALYMALWRLALGRSFPQDADAMFVQFQREYRQNRKDRQCAPLLTRASEYWGMLEPRGDADFSPVARHLCSFTRQDEKQARNMTLKLVLHIRQRYNFIFARLI
ncbi:hypothetical protein [Desulfovibrio legallii]|jgi:hypothetical protein|uniref:Uncharacterized protein n=1 Tax=Desulfovibrio legallii TaxID=571438 RepID=A0A1G7MC83_9BACT|nr:hypothetical protein [Desulfovibrio legallii]SDF59353.1 hypothetical protein SAMN05192586_10881 [Desulfovibrio legallii]